MTLYVCQMRMTGTTDCWSASDEDEARRLVASRYPNTEPGYDGGEGCADLDEAISHDMRAAFWSDNVFEVYAWIEYHEASVHCKARSAFFRAFGSEIEDLVEQQEEDMEGEAVDVAMEGQFKWFQADENWTLGNAEPVEAPSLAHALAEAHLARMTRDSVVMVDV